MQAVHSSESTVKFYKTTQRKFRDGNTLKWPPWEPQIYKLDVFKHYNLSRTLNWFGLCMPTTNKELFYLIYLTPTCSANSDYTPVHCELREHVEHNNEFQLGKIHVPVIGGFCIWHVWQANEKENNILRHILYRYQSQFLHSYLQY
jgi:hypothetical protein